MQRKFLTELEKLSVEFPLMFNDEDINTLLQDLEDELEYLLSSCIKYATGRIQIKKYHDKELVAKYPELETTYGMKYPNGYNSYDSDDSTDGFFLTKAPGLRCHGQNRDSKHTLLLEYENIYLDGDLIYSTNNSNEFFFEKIHFNRLKQLCNEKRPKVISEKVKQFFIWLERLTIYKVKTKEFGGQLRHYYNPSKSAEKSPGLVISFIVNTFANGLLTNNTLPLIKEKLAEYVNKKKEVLEEGQGYLNSLKEINLANKTLQELKSARN
jgi:hypothetical protein